MYQDNIIRNPHDEKKEEKKEKIMICPMPSMSECIKEKCAWWHVLNIQTKKGRCSILTFAVALHWISVNPKHHVIEVKDV